MRYLMDTHILIWYLNKVYKRISKKLLEIIQNQQNEIYISMASLWEITIKLNIGKFKPKIKIEDFIDFIYKSPLILLDIEEKHLLKYRYLPLIHKESFDRMIIATAISEDLTIITHDKEIRKYQMIKWI